MAGRKPFPDRTQIRSKRLSTTLTPAAYDGLIVLARVKNMSASDLISSLVEAVVANNAAVIKDFGEMQKKAAADVSLKVNAI